MKKRRIYIIFFIAALAAAGVLAEVAARKQIPRISVDRLEHDFGRVRYGDVSRTAFTFINAAKAPVRLESISTSCGCTKAEASRDVIPPGGEATLSVSFDPAVHKDDSDLGDVERLVFVRTNDPKHAELIFRIRASVYKP